MPKLGLRRDQLAKISNDPDIIRQFEKLFKAVQDTKSSWPEWAFLTMGASFSSSLNKHFEFSQMLKSGNFKTFKNDLTTEADWATDTGQDLGIIQLESGNTYILIFATYTTGSAPGYITIQAWDRTNDNGLGICGYINSPTNSTDSTNQPLAISVISPETDILVESRIIASSGRTDLLNLYTFGLIVQLRDEE